MKSLPLKILRTSRITKGYCWKSTVEIYIGGERLKLGAGVKDVNLLVYIWSLYLFNVVETSIKWIYWQFVSDFFKSFAWFFICFWHRPNLVGYWHCMWLQHCSGWTIRHFISQTVRIWLLIALPKNEWSGVLALFW